MYYLITEERVYMAKELADFDKFGYSVDYDEITSMVGSDRIIDIRGEEYITNKAFLRDKNKIKNAVMMSALYGAPETKKRDITNYITWGVLAFVMIQVMLMSSSISKVTSSNEYILEFLESVF